MWSLPLYSLIGIILIIQALTPVAVRAEDELLTLTQAESLAQNHAPWLAHHRTNASVSPGGKGINARRGQIPDRTPQPA